MKYIFLALGLAFIFFSCDNNQVLDQVDDSAVVQVTDENFQEKVLGSEEVVLVDFYADWCGPCKQLNPVVAALAKKYQGKAAVVKVNVDKAPAASYKYKVSSIPRLILFKNGEMIKNVESRDLSSLSKEIDAQLY
jgi:thioredoxin 1